MTTILLTELLNKIVHNAVHLDKEPIIRAIEWAVKYHQDQLRDSGEPFYNHPVEVAAILADMGLDTPSVLAALLHDTVEDTSLTLDEIHEEFGDEVTFLVKGLTKLAQIESKSVELNQAENFRKLVLALTDDVRVLFVKLADRLHNMRTIKHKRIASQKRIAFETMEIYAPLAERMGINNIKLELQDLAFEVLYPEVRKSIIQDLENTAYTKEASIEEVIEELSSLLQEMEVPATIQGRKKTPYSIWMKMIQKNINLDQLQDIMAFRIIVPTVGHCYTALGAIHSVYKMVPNMFQDFISNSKSNGYQSLHTIVISSRKQKLEIQIRTQYMHNIAEYGIAAHWRYKQHNNIKLSKYSLDLDMLHQLSAKTSDLSLADPVKDTKLSMYYNQVFCFTPKGKVINLPKGSTILDFAFVLHTDIGIYCIGGKVNGHSMPIKTILNNGDQVEILLSSKASVLPSWEQYAFTSKARTDIRQYLKKQQTEQHIALGHLMLTSLAKTFNIEDIDKLYALLILELDISKESLFRNVGNKEIPIARISSIITQNYFKDLKELKEAKKSPEESFQSAFDNGEDDIIIGLEKNVSYQFAGCCYPIPNEDIIGIIHQGRDVMIHRTQCSIAARLLKVPEIVLNLAWHEKAKEHRFITRIYVILTNTRNSLELFLGHISKFDTKIRNIKFVTQDNNFLEMLCDIEVYNASDIDGIAGYLRSQKNVSVIKRYVK
ncbi:MAG: RelA/SpoT family protein [Rickettsiaceae bacterium]|nr:RelA/SpoT family protein [Rickettsiaceae bacterium]